MLKFYSDKEKIRWKIKFIHLNMVLFLRGPAKAAFYVAEYLFSTGRKQGLKMPLRQVTPRLTEEVNPGYVYAKEIIDKTKNKEN